MVDPEQRFHVPFAVELPARLLGYIGGFTLAVAGLTRAGESSTPTEVALNLTAAAVGAATAVLSFKGI